MRKKKWWLLISISFLGGGWRSVQELILQENQKKESWKQFLVEYYKRETSTSQGGIVKAERVLCPLETLHWRALGKDSMSNEQTPFTEPSLTVSAWFLACFAADLVFTYWLEQKCWPFFKSKLNNLHIYFTVDPFSPQQFSMTLLSYSLHNWYSILTLWVKWSTSLSQV